MNADKRRWVLSVLSVLVLLAVLPALALAAAAESAPPAAGGAGWMSLVWDFVNSPVGVALIGSIVAYLLARMFTWKPAWKALVGRYGPILMQGVKFAEKEIPDDTKNAGLSRLDAALRFVIQLEPALKSASADDLKQALTAVHTQAESNGNLEPAVVAAPAPAEVKAKP